VNVIVVGAGIIGVTVADALASRGVSVTVLDMRSIGRGASQASAGMLAPFTEAHGGSPLLTLGVRSLGMFDTLVEGLRADTGASIEYGRTGTLEVAFDTRGAAELAAAKQTLDGLGVPADLLDQAGVRSVEPTVSTEVIAGLLTRPHGYVGVEGLMRALVHRARAAGAVFESPVEGIGVEERGSTVELRIGGRRETADFIVIAAGSWSGRVRVKNLPALPVRPVRGQLLQLAWTSPTRPSRIVWGPRAYLVPWSTGSLLVGATVEDAGFDERATAEGVRDLTSAAIELLPGAARARFDAVRVGLRPALPDGLPAIGPFRGATRVVAATGHFRNGVLLAPVTGEIVARYVLEGVADEAMKVTSPDRFDGM
jgi:glycine oxidase